MESKELGKLALSKICKEVENSLNKAEDEKMYLVGRLAFVNGTPFLHSVNVL